MSGACPRLPLRGRVDAAQYYRHTRDEFQTTTPSTSSKSLGRQVKIFSAMASTRNRLRIVRRPNKVFRVGESCVSTYQGFGCFDDFPWQRQAVVFKWDSQSSVVAALPDQRQIPLTPSK